MSLVRMYIRRKEEQREGYGCQTANPVLRAKKMV